MRSKRSRPAGLLVGLLPVVVVAGCGESGPTSSGDVPSSATEASNDSMPPVSNVTSTTPPRPTLPPQPPLPTRPVETTLTPPPVSRPDPDLDDLTIATTDLADRLDVDADSIEVVSVERVTWSDGSVGCPQPGMNYTQALVPGSRIVLRAAGAEYAYHAADGRAPFYCPASQATAPTPNPDI